MTTATYILLATASIGMLLGYITRVEARGPYATVGHRHILRELLNGLNLPCVVAITVWAFFVYPWWMVLGGVVFFVTVFALVQGYVLAMLGGLALLEKLMIVRPVLDLALIVGAVTLWWRFYPLLPF